MSIIDKSYFVGEINIPNTSAPEVEEVVNLLIARYEPKLLKNLMGAEFYGAFTTGIEAGTPDQRWIDLRDGVGDWEGMITSTEIGEFNFNQSFIANYVYWYWMANTITQTSIMGEKATKTENAEQAAPSEKAARAWNEMFTWICKMRVFLEKNKETYPEYQTYDRRKCAIREYYRVNTFGI